MNFNDLIVRDTKICGGAPVIKGTRVTLRTVLASLADGDSIEEIVQSFPSLKPEQVKGVISYAAACVVDDLPILEVPVLR